MTTPIETESSRDVLQPWTEDERGAIMVIALFFAVFLVALLFSVVGTARAIFMREHLQDAVDGAVLSGAILNAQAMNLIVLANVVMAALLAILVALKAIEGLCIIAIAICIALAWFTGGSSMAFVPELNHVRNSTREVHEELKGVIFPALEILHDIASEVRLIAPELAKAGAEARLLGAGQNPADKGMVFGKAVTLPVQDDKYKVLCGKAGETVCDVVMMPMGNVGGVKDDIKSACEGFAEGLASWFCEDKSKNGGGGDFPISREQEMLYPRMTKTKECEDGNQQACEWVQAAEPKPDGSCNSDTNCDAYEAFVSAARVQCDPTSKKKPEKYVYQLHTSSVIYTWTGRMWKRGEPAKGHYKKVTAKKKPPCLPGKDKSFAQFARLSTIGYGYELSVHPDGNRNKVTPVCSDEESPAFAPGLTIGATTEVHFKEVTQILGCARTEDYEVPLKKDKEDAGKKGKKSPKEMVPGTELGTEPFMLRGVAWTNTKDDSIRKIVELARWGKNGDGDGFTRMLWLSRFSYAQAEYFYDEKANEESWLWNMKWKARLRRFAAPVEKEDITDMTALCVGETKSRCADLVVKFFLTDLTAH